MHRSALHSPKSESILYCLLLKRTFLCPFCLSAPQRTFLCLSVCLLLNALMCLFCLSAPQCAPLPFTCPPPPPVHHSRHVVHVDLLALGVGEEGGVRLVVGRRGRCARAPLGVLQSGHG
jgi:hypothetical protein